MESLESKIMKNRSEFDHHEPGKGHFERFQQKLEQLGPVRKMPVFYYVKVAMVFLIVSLSSILIYEMIIQPRFENNRYSFGKLSPEYREVEDYFIRTINIRYNNIQNLDMEDNKMKEMVIQEIQEMDQIYKSLSMELEKDPNNDRLINAMIQHYQMKLDIMNEIISQLESIKNTSANNKHNENTEL